ncbi:uncharacterized protein PAC_02815 [Phialocephala subalpina]|uniref:Uncharacterized protein n=1 Tax=Phialocephala subalpina TaxID=576137 RepID=A0A1L7WJI8_9HELO|nr:uncharacterized protein PAC_02815 [Phialocephala subalpina]
MTPTRLFIIVAKPLAKLRGHFGAYNRRYSGSTTNQLNQVAATIISPPSTEDGHNESSAGREAYRQSRLGSSAEQIASALNYCHGNSIVHRGLAIGLGSTGLFSDLFWGFVAPESFGGQGIHCSRMLRIYWQECAKAAAY